MSFSIFEKTNVYINSSNRLSGTPSNFLYNIQVPNDKNYSYDRVCVMTLRIPKSYYMIDEPYNTFILRENLSDIIISIPKGNYSKDSLMYVVKNLMNANTLNGITYDITYPNVLLEADTGKYTFTSNNAIISQFLFDEDNRVHRCLGFDHNYENGIISIDYSFNSALSITSPNVIHHHSHNVLYLKSNLCDNHTNSFNNPILLEIDTNISTMDDIVFQCPDVDGYSRDVSKDNESVYSFILTNQFDEIVNLNGKELNISLTLYKKDDTNEIQREISQMKLLENINTLNQNIQHQKGEFMILSSTPNFPTK